MEGGEAQPWGAPQMRVSENTDGNSSKFDVNDKFAIQIDGKDETGTCTVQADGSVKAETPLYWSDRLDHAVYVWYPATDGDWTETFNEMNGALAGTGWQYEMDSSDGLPELNRRRIGNGVCLVRIRLTGKILSIAFTGQGIENLGGEITK